MKKKIEKLYQLPFIVYGIIFSPICPIILALYIGFLTDVDLGSVLGYVLIIMVLWFVSLGWNLIIGFVLDIIIKKKLRLKFLKKIKPLITAAFIVDIIAVGLCVFSVCYIIYFMVAEIVQGIFEGIIRSFFK